MLKKISYVLMLSTLLVFNFGCASKAKKQEIQDVAPVATEATSDFELNGDSDSKKAGGLQTIYFDYNAFALTGSARATLDSNADLLKSNPNVRIQVEGHCDERGGVQYNLALGEKRAKAVKEYLIAVGVTSDRISTISYGKERPVAFGHEDDSWSQNRRGNFVVTSK